MARSRKVFFSLILVCFCVPAKAQIDAGDVDAYDFEPQIRKILNETDIEKCKEVDFECIVQGSPLRSSVTRLFYYFTSDTTVESTFIEVLMKPELSGTSI